MEQNNSISNKSFKGLIFMNIILIILVVCLIGYIVYDKVIVDRNNTNNNNTIINPIDNNDNKVEENKETERIDANVLYNNVSTMIEGFITKELTPYLMKFNHNYMTDKVAQNNLVVSALLSDQSIKKEYDVDAYGEEASGYVRFNKTDFTNMYINIVGIAPDYNQIVAATNDSLGQVKAYNDMVSGVLITGPHIYDLKYSDVTYSDGMYTVKIDYTTEEISAIIEIKLTVNQNNTYKFNSLIVFNK